MSGKVLTHHPSLRRDDKDLVVFSRAERHMADQVVQSKPGHPGLSVISTSGRNLQRPCMPMIFKIPPCIGMTRNLWLSAELRIMADQVILARNFQSQLKAPPVWYSVTRVSKKFFSFFRSRTSDIHGKGLLTPGYCSGRPIWLQRRLAMNCR